MRSSARVLKGNGVILLPLVPRGFTFRGKDRERKSRRVRRRQSKERRESESERRKTKHTEMLASSQ